ncbi:MAG: metallophosphoesterase [Deltaproteobacteria bacterium]|nr:MAG: metallophosphoesterase [Deltaproteobacteria bacterium]
MMNDRIKKIEKRYKKELNALLGEGKTLLQQELIKRLESVLVDCLAENNEAAAKDRRVVSLPRKGNLKVFADIHGNWKDYSRIKEIFLGSGKDCYLVLLGDYIHGSPGYQDESEKVLDDLIKLKKRYRKRVIPLLGDHEHSYIGGPNVSKHGVNQTLAFEYRLSPDKMKKYREFFRSLPLLVKTDNGIAISHSGPVRAVVINEVDLIYETNMIDYDDFADIDPYEFRDNTILGNLLWNRNYNQEDARAFLDALSQDGNKCFLAVYGHTPVDGYRMVGGNQLILSPSCFLEIDLSERIKSVEQFKRGMHIKKF